MHPRPFASRHHEHGGGVVHRRDGKAATQSVAADSGQAAKPPQLVRGADGSGPPLRAGSHLLCRFPRGRMLRELRLVLLLGRSADDFAESPLEALGTAVGTESRLRLRLLLGPALAVEA